MIGLANMVVRLAWKRADEKLGHTFNGKHSEYVNTNWLEARGVVEGCPLSWFPFSREYYRIIDRIAAGKKP